MRKTIAVKGLSAKAPIGRYLRAEIRLILPDFCSNLTVFKSRNLLSRSQVSMVLEKALVTNSSNTCCHPRREDSNDAERR